MKYTDYLKTEYWIERRKEFRSKTWNRCYICRKKNCILDTHHKRYKDDEGSILFREKHTDLRLLCRECHSKIHELKLEKALASNLIKRRKIRDIIYKKLWKHYLKNIKK